jgi:ketosteroid isomerase-like protein
LIDFITKEDSGIDFWDFEFENPFDVEVIGDTAINHYRIRFKGRNLGGTQIDEAIHVTHTWIKEDTQWKLLSGMAYETE